MYKIAVIGVSGRMGSAIKEMVQNDGDCQAVLVSSSSDGNAADCYRSLEQALHHIEVDAVIDFTSIENSLSNLSLCSNQAIPIVIGTTGFNQHQISNIQQLSKKTAVVLSYNMSIGVNLMCYLLQYTAKVIGQDADIEVIEAHHRNKIDAPSGTALMMGEAIAQTLGFELEQHACFTRHGETGVRKDKQIGFSAIRAGDIIGDHTALFAIDGERIEISHKATNRSIYAKGATQAAKWLIKKPAGLYSMRHVLGLN